MTGKQESLPFYPGRKRGEETESSTTGPVVEDRPPVDTTFTEVGMFDEVDVLPFEIMVENLGSGMERTTESQRTRGLTRETG